MAKKNRGDKDWSGKHRDGGDPWGTDLEGKGPGGKRRGGGGEDLAPIFQVDPNNEYTDQSTA